MPQPGHTGASKKDLQVPNTGYHKNDTLQVRMCRLHGYSTVDGQHDSGNVSGLV